MRQACTRFSHYLCRRFGRSTTRKHYLSDLNTFLQMLGEKTPGDITAADIDTFIDRQIASGLCPSTINRRLSTLHSFFEFLAAEQPERSWPNPVYYRRHRLKPGSQLPRDVRDSDVARLFAVITDIRDRAMFGLMVGAGLRVGEVAMLQLDGVETPTAFTHLTKLRVRGKGGKERVVWLSPSLWAMTQDWLRVRPAVATDVPELTQQIARAAFPNGNRYMTLRDELGAVFDDE